MNEPMTVLTDYALGGMATWLSLLLFPNPQASRRLWALAFAALAAAAFLGGTWHGFLQSALLWKATTLSAGVASFGMVAGSSYAVFSGPIRAFMLTAALAKLVVYSVWMLGHDAFLYVVIDTAIAFLVVAAIHLWKWNGPILAGVAVSIAGAAVQASGFRLHEHFNHNDLYHVIQMVALVLLYRGAKRLQSS
ncbi:MAG TPA: hypothetical protein VJ797_02925 [Burkholderiales bacterium]|nr:hypothetical protein [Burkholderiales bacterium]